LFNRPIPFLLNNFATPFKSIYNQNMSDQEKIKRTDVNQLGEFGLIEHLTQNVQLQNKSSLKGIGDDAAVIDNGNFQTVISTDILVEGIHFDLMYTPLKHLGYKSVVVNLSDIYAMNATPKQITVSIALSNRFSVEALEELYAGIKLACDKYKVDLIGGDTTSSPKGLFISVTAIGQGEKNKLTYRNTAKVGDLVCISGNVGAAYLGLQLLERERQVYLANPGVKPDLEDQDYLVGRILKPEARKDMIEFFAKNKLVPTAMIDVSDGVASELFHICKQSGVGAFIEESGVPIHPDAEMMAIKFNLDPITCALSGGEDYELIFTIDPNDVEKVKYLPDIYIMGEIVPASDGLKLHTKGGNIHEITAQGWQHFDPNNQ
jgi:thiamine-monophosphate kinase